jgi:hypothetical protein
MIEKEEFTIYLSEIFSRVACMSETDFSASFKDDTIRFVYFHNKEPYKIRIDISINRTNIGGI